MGQPAEQLGTSMYAMISSSLISFVDYGFHCSKSESDPSFLVFSQARTRSSCSWATTHEASLLRRLVPSTRRRSQRIEGSSDECKPKMTTFQSNHLASVCDCSFVILSLVIHLFLCFPSDFCFYIRTRPGLSCTPLARTSSLHPPPFDLVLGPPHIVVGSSLRFPTIIIIINQSIAIL